MMCNSIESFSGNDSIHIKVTDFFLLKFFLFINKIENVLLYPTHPPGEFEFNV